MAAQLHVAQFEFSFSSGSRPGIRVFDALFLGNHHRPAAGTVYAIHSADSMVLTSIVLT